MTSKDDLVALVPPLSDGQSAPVDWDTFESSLGFGLPEDYKWLIDTYGPGKFDNFLHVLQPYPESEYVSLGHWMVRGREILRQVSHREEQPYAVDDLLPVATTDNGDTIYWIARPLDRPDAWTITGNEARGASWPAFDGGIVDFLAEVISGRLHFEIFPRDFPSDEPRFSRYSMRRRQRRP
jgi:hypothetical protein